MSKRVFLYVRVSTQEQANEGYSVKEQEERLKAYAKSRDYTVVKSYVDGGYTGANLDRPALQEMIKNIKKVDHVLVYKLDRLSRSQKDTLYLIEEVFLKNNVDFVSLNESFDTSTPFGRAMIGILSVFAQLEREQTKERSMMGREARAKEGYYHGGDPNKIMIGYDYVDGKLIINEYEAECVKYIFSSYLKGKGFRKIFDEISIKYPNAVNNESTVKRILKRPVYKGSIIFNKKEYQGNHIPIINKLDFDNVQKIMNKKSSKYGGTSKNTYLLTGLLYCGHCGARMAGKAGKKLKSGETLKYYVCYTRRGTPKHMMMADSCNKSFERKEVIENKIINELKKLKISDITSKEKEVNENKVNILIKQVDKIDNQISKTVDLFSLGNIPIDVLTKKIDGLNEDKEKLLSHINELSSDPVDLDEIKEIIPKLKNINNWDVGIKQTTLIKLINKITVYNDKMAIEWAL